MSDNSNPLEPSSPTSDRPNYLRSIGIFFSVGVLLTAAVGGVFGYQRVLAYRQATPSDRIPMGVQIAGIDVGGLSHDEAYERVRPWAVEKLAKPVTFIAPRSDRRWNITLGEVGGRFDLEDAITNALKVGKGADLWEQLVRGGSPHTVEVTPKFLLNEAGIDRHLGRIARSVDQEPVNARARITDSGEITIAAPEKKGLRLDTAATRTALLQSGSDSLRDGGQVTLVMREERPRITSADIGKIGTLLASFTTEYSSSTSERAHNVELAAAKINGTMLAPDEEFSYNRVVGPREAEYGWRNALMFQDGEVVPGLGGGVCQVASTLYNTVLRTNLKVTRRQNHSIKVHYVDPGRDATVVYGALDFCFTNTSEGPVLLLARTHRRRLTMNIYGLPPKEKQTFEIVSGPQRYNSMGGITVATYRIVHHSDGKTTREYLHTDSYRAPQARSNTESRPRRVERRARTTTSPISPTPAIKPALITTTG